MAVRDDAPALADPPLVKDPPEPVGVAPGRVELVQVEVDGARDVALERVARVAVEALELLGRTDVDERDVALLEKLHQLVAGQRRTSSRKSTSSPADLIRPLERGQVARAGDARKTRIRERSDHRLGVGGRRQPVLLADQDQHWHVDRGQRGPRIEPVADRLLHGDERRDRLLESELMCTRDDGRVRGLGEDLRRQLLPERLAPGLAQEPDGVVSGEALLGRVRRRAGADEGQRRDPVRRLSPQLEREIAPHRRADGDEGPSTRPRTRRAHAAKPSSSSAPGTSGATTS